jgi:hypothetical protein
MPPPMRISWIILVAAALAVTSIGCGTLANFGSDQPQPFGGVARDTAFLVTPAKTNFHSGDDGRGAAFFLGIWAADLCLSGVADTLTLPLFVYWEKKREREEKPSWEEYMQSVYLDSMKKLQEREEKAEADREKDPKPPPHDSAGTDMTGQSPRLEKRGEPVEPNTDGGSRPLWLPPPDPLWLHPPGAGPSVFPGLPLSGIQAFPY